MSYSSLQELCDAIKVARESKKLTLQKLTGSLKIRIDYLEAIEAAEFEKLPLGYERIFLKTYLKQLDVNLEEFLDCADRIYFEKKSETETSSIASSDIDLSQFKKVATWTPVVLVLVALVYFVVTNFSQEGTIVPVKEITVEQAKTTIDTVVTPIVAEDTLSVDSLDLRIELLSAEFFYIKIDSVYEVIKTGRRGNSYNYKALNNFNIYVADGSNTRIFLNDTLVQDKTQKDYRINYLYLTKNGVIDKSITKIKLEEENVEKNNPIDISADSLISQ